MTPLEVFEKINARFQTAILFHKESSDLFLFLGLKGFHKLHEKQYKDESKQSRNIKKFVIENHNHMIIDEAPQPIIAFPVDWLEKTRGSIPQDERIAQVKISFENYYKWETETRKAYLACAKELLGAGQLNDYEVVMNLVKDVQKEIVNINEILLKLEFTNYDATSILDMQTNMGVE